MKRLKIFLVSMLMTLVGCASVMFSACGENNENMTISLSTSHLEITLGENDNTGSVFATVENASNKTVSVSCDSASLKVTVGKPSSEGVSEIVVTALRACQNIEVFVNGKTKSTSFTVTATEPITSITPNQSSYYLSYDETLGGSFTLDNSLFSLSPEGTSQTELLFNLVDAPLGVTISNNVITVQPGLEDVPQSITVEVVSMHRENVKATISVDVVKAIDVNKVQIVDASGAQLDYIEMSRTNDITNIVSVYVRVPFEVTTKELNVVPVFAYNDRGIILYDSSSYPVKSGEYYEYMFNFTLSTEKVQLGQDTVWFLLSDEKYPDLVYSTANSTNGKVNINVIDEITDISITNDGNIVNTSSVINLYTTYTASLIEGYALTFSAVPSTATSDKLSLNISAADRNYLIVRDSKNNVVEFTNNKYTFDSGETFYFIARSGFTLGEEITVTVKSEKENIDISKTITFALQEGVTSLGFVNSLGDGIQSTKELYLDTNENSTTLVKVAVAPQTIDLTDRNVAEIYSTNDCFTIGEIVNTTETLNGATVYSIEIVSNHSGSGELVISFVSGQSIRATVNVIDELSDVKVEIEPNFSTSTAVGDLRYENYSLAYVALKNGQSLPLAYTADAEIESISFNFVDYVYDENVDDVYDKGGAYAVFGNNRPADDMFTNNTSAVISANYLRSLNHISPITVGKVWIRMTFTGKQVIDDDGELVYADVQISKYLLVEVYNPIISVEISTKELSLYPADELGQENAMLAQDTITLIVNRGTALPTYNLLEIEGMTKVDENLYQYFIPGGKVNFEIERLNDYQFLVRALTRNDDGEEGVGDTEFQSTIINFVSKDLNLEYNKYSLSLTITMAKPQLVEEVVIGNVGENGINLLAQNLTDDISLTSFKLVTTVYPSNALNKGVVYRFIPDSGTLGTIVSIDDNGYITTTGAIGGSGKIRVIPKDSVFVDEHGHEYYRDGYCYAEVNILVSDGRSRETAIRISDLDDITNSSLHYILLNNVTYSKTTQLFDVFSGGLYGSITSGSNDVVTIKMNNSSNLFGTLDANATIEDLTLVGNVNASSMLVDLNMGTIKNVTVDVYTEQDNITPSTVSYSEGNAGGIAQTNAGFIQNVTFVGNVLATGENSVAGGIVAVNSGEIDNCKVLFYNLKDSTTTKINASQVGFIAGELNGQGIIKSSYAYNFSKDSATNSQNVGAIVGLLSSSSAKIKQSFAEVGSVSNIYSSLGQDVSVDNLSSIISDSYVTSSTNDGTYTFSYYMTNNLGRVVFGTFDSNSTQTYPNVSMNTTNALWYNYDKEINHGFPYLYNLQPPKTISSDELSQLKIVQSRLSLAENGDENGYEAVMFLFKSQGVNLTERERNLLTSVNTISYGDLFGTYALGGLIITSSNTNVIETSPNGLIVKNIGNTTLTVSSRYDYSVGTREISVNVIYYTSAFNLEYKNQNLGSSSTINVRTKVNETLSSSLTSSIILVDRSVPLAQNDFDVKFVDENDDAVGFILGTKIGTHTIVGDFKEDTTNVSVYLNLQGLSQNNASSLREYTQKTITLQKIYGPVTLSSSVKSATISPSDRQSVVVEITSDSKYLENLTGSELVVNIYNSSGEISEDVLYDISYNESTDQTVNADGTTTRRYTLSIYLDTSLSNFDDKYTVKFSTDSPSDYDDVSAELVLNVLNQEVLRVDVNHYAFKGVGATSGVSLYDYYPNNVLSPGTTGLLDVMVYPSYAKYTDITVTSPAQNGFALSFLNMMKAETGNEEYEPRGYKVNLANTFEYITNGIKVYKVDNASEVARYYVQVKVPQGVAVDTVYTITINVYDGEQLVYSLPYSLIIVPQEKAGITVNGQSSIYAIRGDTITADIVWDQTQSIRAIEALSLDSDQEQAVGVIVPPSISDADKEEYSTSYYRASISIKIGEESNSFRVRVATSRTINGVEETVYSYLVVYVIDFELDFTNTHIANEDGSDTVQGDQYFYHSLEFNFGGRYVKNEDGSISASQRAYETFVEQHYYDNNDYKVNTIASQNGGSLLYNLYYVSNNIYTPVITSNGQTVVPENAIVEFLDNGNGVRFIGLANGTQQMMLQMRAEMPDGTIYTYTYFFTIVISEPTSDDAPKQISSADGFLEAFTSDTEDDYILTQDIYLYNHTPIQNTESIRSLDGNGYQVVIVGFNYDNTQSQINLALFDTISSNTTIKNLRVNMFHAGTIQINSAYTQSVNYAPFAITNNGIITNCEVVSYRKITNELAPNINGLHMQVDSTIGVSALTSGFVITNEGIITNSRVGGDEAVEYIYNTQNVDGEIINTGAVTPRTIILSPFVISSFGEVSGFVYRNTGNGHIVSSYASNIRIINNSNIDYTTVTTGFVSLNEGYISGSYSKGVKRNETDVHASLYGIETSGISAGFVYENSGEINNSYSNITLTNQNNNPGRNSAGFVYRNTSTGVIDTSLSLSRIIGSTTTQMNFAGVDDFGNYQNKGKISNSYYYDEVSLSDSSILIESAYGEGAEYISNINLEDYFYGFSFANKISGSNDDGIWVMTDVGPELVAANQIAVSLRYASKQSLNSKPVFTYVDEYRYGSKNNPILIRSAEEFSNVFSGLGNTSASRYVNTSLGEIYGSYRLVNDIDLSELVTDSNNTYSLASSSMALTGKYIEEGDGNSIGKFDGNGLTITGLALSDPDGEAINFGLFASIENGAIVQNVNLVLGSTNAGGDVFGVEASGVEYVGALAGTVKDAKVINVTVSSLYPDTNSVTVRGRNVVGGLIGRVIGDSYVFNLSADSISVTASMNPTDYVQNSIYISYNPYNRTSDILNASISYAGGVIGVLDIYTDSSIDIVNYVDSEISADGNAVMLKTLGTSIISGGTVGGITGYVGPISVLQDALYELSYVDSSAYTQQGLYSYNGFAGGIVGYNAGYIRQVRSEHEYLWQIGDENPDDEGDKSIEANIKNYYQGNTAVDRGNTKLFETAGYTPIAIGGLVGLQVSGKIEKSYSKLNVINTNSNVRAGGVVGIIEHTSNELEGENTVLFEVYASGDVEASIAGGIAGYINGRTRLENVNAINYWGNWLVDDTQSGTAYAIADIKNGVNVIGTAKILSFRNVDIEFHEQQDESAIVKNPTTEKYISNSQISNSGNISSLYSNITGYGDDGENFDVYFTGNDWDKSSWERDDNELYPHIIFGYTSNIQYIRTQDDIDLMRTAKEGDVFVISPDDGNNDNIEINGVKYIGITRPIAPITTFSGTLRGLDSRERYGFLFKSGSQQTRSLFLNTVGATFSNFTVAMENGVSLTSANVGQNALFVSNATNTQFSDLIFENVHATINSSTSRFGLVVGLARGSTTFRNVEILNSDITLSGTSSPSLYLGLMFGDSNFVGGAISNTIIRDSNIIFENLTNANENSIKVGLVGGRLSSSGLGLTDISIDGIEDTTSTTKQYGIRNSQVKFVSTNTNKTSVNGMHLGLLFGEAYKSQISSKGLNVNLSAKNVNFTSGNSSNLQSMIGGLIGMANGCTFAVVDTKVAIDISAESSHIGGLVGYLDNCNFADGMTDIKVSNNGDKDIEVVGLNVVNGSIASRNYVGGVFGTINGGNLQRNTNDNYKHAIKTNLDITISKGAEEVSVGAVAGQIIGDQSSVTLRGVESYGDINLTNTTIDVESGYSIFVGGIVGKVSGSADILDSYSFGDVKHIVKQQQGNQSNYSNISLTMAGIAAYVSNDTGDTLRLEDNVSAGNFYPSFKQNDASQSMPYVKSVSIRLDSLVYGGLLGNGVAYLEVRDNISVATIYNKFDLEIAENYSVNALIGSKDENFVTENSTDSATNYYAHVATLCTDTFGTNVLFGSIIYGNDGETLLKNGIRNIIDIDEEHEEQIYNGELGGTKLNPTTNIPSNSSDSTTYVYLGEGTDDTNPRFGALSNTMVIADGREIVFEYDSNYKDKKYASPFESVDDNSSISGVVIIAQYEAEDSKPVAGLVMTNNGIVYSCNVRHKVETSQTSTIELTKNTYPQKIVGTLSTESDAVAGLVGINGSRGTNSIINSGLVKDCFVNVDISTNYEGTTAEPYYVGMDTIEGETQDVAVGGIVGTNNGIVINSYSSGTVTAPNAVKKDGPTLYVYLFSAGKVYDCYTNMKMVYEYNDKDNEDTGLMRDKKIYAYSQTEETLVVNSQYDKISAEYYVNSDEDKLTEEKLTDKMSVDYNGGGDIEKIGTFNYIASQAYGYGSFSGDVYKNIDYMHHDTGNGDQQSPYQIINLGKLKQIEKVSKNADSVTYFNLINDINASYVSDKDGWQEWNSLDDINNINFDGYDTREGITHAIKNLNTRGGGIFKNVNNSSISNLIIDKVIFSRNGNYVIGLLANHVSGSGSTISNITILSIDSSGFEVSDRGASSLYYGNVVGELADGAQLSECELSTNSGDSDVLTISVVITSLGAFVYGGMVGVVDTNAIVKDCSINKKSMMIFEDLPGDDITFISGGVVGLLKDGTVTNSYLTNSMYVFSHVYSGTNSKNNELISTSNGIDIKLYVGGIVGVAGTLDGSLIENNSSGEITNCGLTGNSEIYAGNPYNISASYVGGISAYGGNISNCYNSAANIVGSAKYNYNVGDSDTYLNEDKITTSTHPRLYKNSDGSMYEKYKKLVYARATQDAYVAGIANSYDSVENVVTNTINIYGGLDARRALAYYDFDTGRMYWLAGIMQGVVAGASVGIVVALGLVASGVLSWLGLIKFAAIAAVISVAVGFINNFDIDIPMYYVDGSGYVNGNEYVEESEYYTLKHSAKGDWFSGSLQSVIDSLSGGLWNEEKMKELTLLVGKPKESNTHLSALDKYVKDNGNQPWMGLIQSEDGYVYNNYLNKFGNTNLYVYNVNYHSIGREKEEGASTKNVAWHTGVYKEVAKQVSQTYNSQTTTNKSLYSFNDYEIQSSDYKYLWDTSDKVIESLEYLVVKDGSEDGLKIANSWSDSLNWTDWQYNGNNYILADSDEIKSTSPHDMLNNNIVAEGTQDDATANIYVNNIENYRGAVNIVNDILDNDNYTIDGLLPGDESTFQSLKSAIKNGNVTINLNFVDELSFDNNSVDGFGTKDNPFSGTITASTRGTSKAKIRDFRLNDTANSGSVGLVAYAKDVKIDRVSLSITSQTVLSTSNIEVKNVGGLIGTVVSGGNVEISRCTVDFTITDSTKDNLTSTRAINLGSIIGKVEDNSTVKLTNTNSSLVATLNASNTQTTSDAGVGGLVGNISNSALTFAGKVYVGTSNDSRNPVLNMSITSTSVNNTFGGLVGKMLNSSINEDSDNETTIIVQGDIDVENTAGTNIYAGGLVGYFDGQGQIESSEINIDLSKISASAGVLGTTTYSAGLFGYNGNNPSTLPISLGSNINVGNENSKLIITSGIAGTEFASKAYADNFVGNRGEGYSWGGVAITNTSVLAMAKPSYSPDVEDDLKKPSDDLLLSSKQVSATVGENSYVSDGKSTTLTEYLKIDVYEYETQVDSNIENSYINGEQQSIYNYQKNVYVIVTYGSAEEDTYNGNDVHHIKESVYKLTMNGYRVDDSVNPSDIQVTTTLDLINAHEFYTTSNIFLVSAKNGYAIDMSIRDENFVPNVPFLKMVAGDKSYIYEPCSKDEGLISYSGFPVVTRQGETYINMGDISIKESYTSDESVDQSEMPDFSGMTQEEIDDWINNNSGEDLPDIKPEIVKDTVYNRITLDEKNNLILKYRYKKNSNSDYTDGEKDVYTQRDGIIYNKGQDSQGGPYIDTKITDTDGNILDVDDIKNTTSTEFYINLPSGSKYLIDSGSRVEGVESLQIHTTVSDIMKVDGTTNRQYRLIFISLKNGFEEEQNVNAHRYTEYVYLLDQDLNIYALGNISYVTATEVKFDSNIIARNSMFFPKGIQVMSYENNLFALNNIKKVTTFDDIVFNEVTTKDQKSSYFIDVTSQNVTSSASILTTSTTYLLKLGGIEASSLSNIKINVSCEISQETKTEDLVENKTIYIMDSESTRIYTIKDMNVFASESDYDTNPLSSTLVFTKEADGESIDMVYVFNYSEDGFTGFTEYSGTSITKSPDGESYIIVGVGEEHDAYGKNDIIDVEDTQDPNDFGVAHATIGNSYTLLTLTNTLTNGKTIGYFQLDGANYNFTYDVDENTLTVTRGDESYVFIFDGNQFVLSSYTFKQTLPGGEEYTITEKYLSSTSMEIEITSKSVTKTVTVQNTSWTYFVGSTIETSPTKITSNFDYVIEDWYTTSSNVYKLDTNGFIKICEKGNELPFAILERQTLTKITQSLIASGNNSAHIYVLEDNNINIFIKQNGEWTLFKAEKDVYKDLERVMFTKAEITQDNNITVLRLYKNDYEYINYDISNGYILAGKGSATMTSKYSTQTMEYDVISYYATTVNDVGQTITTVGWKYNNKNVSLNLSFGLNTSDVELIPFNEDYAIKLSNNIYYTRSGYQISGVIGDEMILDDYSSLGVGVPSGISILVNNASFTIDNGETILVKEYVYVRYNLNANWYSELNDPVNQSFKYEVDNDGNSVTVQDTVSRGDVVVNNNIASFTETIVTSSGGDGIPTKYVWSFDTSVNLIKYYQSDSLVVSPENDYNRYADLDYENWGRLQVGSPLASTVISITNGGAVTNLDVVFGDLNYQLAK